jgi:2-polyprenyl-3-methyl-5-hydroxy-6-metoxy-1,4-benzoquinol methylase
MRFQLSFAPILYGSGNIGVPMTNTFLHDAAELKSAISRIKVDKIQTLKERARHNMYALGLFKILDIYRSLRGLNTNHYKKNDVKSAFSEIYQKNVWVIAGDQQSLSGTGSSLEATEGLYSRIESCMTHLKCGHLLDVGCGDWNWMKNENIKIKYTGIDIVPSVIERNQKYASAAVKFLNLNAIVDSLPNADMVLCREVLFHLSFSDATKLMRNVAGSTQYFAATTDFDIGFNSDIHSGDFRKINLMKAPFNLPVPVCLIPDNLMSAGRYIAVWSSDQLKAELI